MPTNSTTRRLRYDEALREATAQEMARDERVVVMGLGVDDWRGIYGTTKGLMDTFGPERVFDTPLSEDAMTGVAIGAAMAGLRPIHVHIRQDFLLLCMNQLVNIAAKAHSMYGGRVSVPMVVRSVIGKSWGQGAQHSQALQSMFMHVPGLKVVAPSTPYDAKGTLIQSIRDNNPVMFVEHRLLHYTAGSVPEESYTVPLGKGRVLAEGSDVTLVGISWMANEALRARAYLGQRGISAEVIDPVTLSPLDMETIRHSADKTGNVVVVDSAWTNCGASAEILARLGEGRVGGRSPCHPEEARRRIRDSVAGHEKRILLLAGSPQDDKEVASQCGPRTWRLGFAPTTCPTTRCLEDLFYPNPRSIASFVNTALGGDEAWSPAEMDFGDRIEFKGPF